MESSQLIVTVNVPVSPMSTIVPSFAVEDANVNGRFAHTDENGNTISIPIERIGAQEFYALPASVVPQNMTYGGGNDHVVASVEEPTEPQTETE